jgi:mevalonate pyrophosphate decarboxylase
MKGLYSISETYGEELLNTGLDYSDVILKKTTSSYLFKNETVSGFIVYLNDIMFDLIENVKKIRVFVNFTVDKNYKKIN